MASDDDDDDCFCVSFSTLLDYHRKQLQKPQLTAAQLWEHCKTSNENNIKEASQCNKVPEVVSIEDSICFSKITLDDGGRPVYQNRCVITGLPKTMKIEDVENLFSKYGHIVESKLVANNITGEPSRGYGFVSFAREKSMYDAVEGLNGHTLGGHVVSVSVSKFRKNPGVKDIVTWYGEDDGTVRMMKDGGRDDQGTFFQSNPNKAPS